MFSRALTGVLCAAAVLLIAAAATMARNKQDPSQPTYLHAKTSAYSFQQANVPHELVSTRFVDLVGPRPHTVPSRIAIGGVANSYVTSPGVAVEASYDDWQSSTRGRRIDFRGTPDIHFGYNDQAAAVLDQFRMGYNVYDPVGGNWPQGLGNGCEIQAPGDVGAITSIAITPLGRAVLAGFDGDPADNHLYYQPATAYSCTWGAGTMIPWTAYSSGLANSDANTRLFLPIIETQLIANDTVVHMIARPTTLVSRAGETIEEFQLQYFRKTGSTASGSWMGPVILDTMYAYAHIAASRVNSKVAVCYTRTSESGFANNQELDEAAYIKESIDGGQTWPSGRTQITPSNRSLASISPWLETQCLYDSNGDLHVVFNASQVPANPYTPGYEWNSLYRGSNVYHWSSVTNTYSMVYNATWPEDQLPGDLCGWIGYDALTTAYMSIAECAGRLYVFWSMANDMNTPGQPHDDCASGGAPEDPRFMANADIFMSVSNDLAGILWDFPRNITNTYTPNCDSATGGGVCMSEVKASVAPYALDSSVYGASLIWPETSLTPGLFIRPNDSALQLFYVEDHYPGQWALSDPFTFVPTLNPLRWVRIACGAPICYPRVHARPDALTWPNWIKPGQTQNHAIEIFNAGCENGNIGQISTVKQTLPESDWLRIDKTTMYVPGGWATDVLNVTIDATNLVFPPGSFVGALIGKVYLTDITPESPVDTVVVDINIPLVDTVVGLTWDTLSTICTQLIVSSNGDMGNLGYGGLNLDYVRPDSSGSDCDPSRANWVYLYSGGPMVIRKTGASSYVFSSALFQGDFTTFQAFKNIEGTTAARLNTVNYDGFYTGNMVNRDSSVALSRTYYAPKGSACNFVIAETKYWGHTGSVANVMISEIVDWDVPGIGGSTNKSGVSVKGFVYQRGTDTTTTCPDSARWAAQALLGYFTKSEYEADAFVNHDVPYGMYAQLNDSVFKYDTADENIEAGYFYNVATFGFQALGSVEDDQHSVLTVLKDATLSGTDTLIVYTVYLTVMQGTLSDLEAAFSDAWAWYLRHRGIAEGCCVGQVGNVDCDPLDHLDVSDVTMFIDGLFVGFGQPCCREEWNCDGDPFCNIDVGDLTALIDHLFINFTPLPECTNMCPPWPRQPEP